MHMTELPAISVTSHVTVVVPRLNVDPEVKSHETADWMSISVTVGSDQDTCVLDVYTLGGQVKVGTVWSVTRIADMFLGWDRIDM